MRTLQALSSAAIALTLCTSAWAQETVDKRIRNSDASFREVMGEPDKGIPRDLFEKAECIVIIPDVLKAAFIVGGKYGRGFVSCRQGASRRFGAPAAIRIEGGSFGLQIGGSEQDVLLLAEPTNDLGLVERSDPDEQPAQADGPRQDRIGDGVSYAAKRLPRRHHGWFVRPGHVLQNRFFFWSLLHR